MAKLLNMQKYAQRLAGLQVSDTVYGQTIPLMWGRGRASFRLIYYGNFQGPTNDGLYTVNADFLWGYGPFENLAATGWVGGNWFYPTFATQTFTPSGTGTSFTVNVTVPSGQDFICIDGVQLQVDYNISVSDYVFPGQTNSYGETGTSELPLYNGFFILPNSGTITNVGEAYPYALYNESFQSTQVTVQFPEPVTNPTFTVIYHYAVPLSGGILLVLGQVSAETELGQGGNSGQPIIYPEFSGCGGANIELGTTPQFPQLSVEVKGLFGMGNSGPGGSLVQGSNNQFSYVQQTSSGDCCPADAILDLVTSGNHIYFYPA